MASSTKDALFIYRIYNKDDYESIEHERPVPSFLCDPTNAISGSQQYLSAFFDVLTVVNAEFHDECMKNAKDGCARCGNPAIDALKSPMPYLHLPNPLVVTQVMPVCSSKECEAVTKEGLQKIQNAVAQNRSGIDGERSDLGRLICQNCQKTDVKKCGRCGTVAYCSKECQKKVWRTHKRVCFPSNMGVPVEDPEDMPM
ncbi:uncharacterized protein KY384_004716 [Bacidia gigantensis]|uniref:uncharacterized protein n=1 Tax=Bacidia gigantensis TaxID=2732470 RepID=UPI001D04553B|nr:uncharacterized protein KY384_004716 [Bacidia gigantensis]KAG8530216.1 hypothetical protein KY384_004716 [Bacidia gigantensis]